MKKQNFLLKFLFATCLLLFAFLPLSSLAAKKTSSELGLDKIIAEVNDDIITQSEFNQRLNSTRHEMQLAHVSMPEKKLRENVLNSLIYRSLQLQLAKKNNLSVGDAELTQSIQNIAQGNHISLDALKADLKKRGMAFTAFREQIREQMLFAKLQQIAISQKITVSDQEVANFLAENKGRLAKPSIYHVLDILTPSQDAALKIKTALEEGKPLKEIIEQNPAWKNSVKPSDLGIRPISAFPDMFAKEIPSLGKDTWSKPIAAPNGIHLLKVVEQKTAEGNPAGKITREEATQILYRQKMDAELHTWLEGLRKNAYVKINDE
jgi:peptidyl-prolyl cis-trans isomerase SurA